MPLTSGLWLIWDPSNEDCKDGIFYISFCKLCCPLMIFIEKLYLVKKLYLSNSISSYFLASRSRTWVREFGRELSYKGDVMVRQRFTALCSTAMVSSIMDSPSNLYKVLTVSTEFVTNFWKWSQCSTDHQKCVVIFFWKFLVKVIEPAKFWLFNVKYIWIFSKKHFSLDNIRSFWEKHFLITSFFKDDLFSKMILPTSGFCGSKKFVQRCSKKFSMHFLWSVKY